MYKSFFFAVLLSLSINSVCFAQAGIEFFNLQWRNNSTEIEEAHLDDRVIIEFETNNIPNGAIIDVEIWSITDNELRDLIDNIQGEVINGIVRIEWEIKFDNNVNINSAQQINERGYTIIDYYFTVKYNDITSSSNRLPIYSYFDYLILDDITGEPIRNSDFLLFAPNGRFLMGTTNEDGRAIMRNLRIIGSYSFIM